MVRPNDYNYVAVRVNNELSEETLPCGTTLKLRDGTTVCGPYFDFFNYAGLQRPVRLLATPRERVEDLAYEVTLAGADAQVAYQVATSGTHEVRVTLADATPICGSCATPISTPSPCRYVMVTP